MDMLIGGTWTPAASGSREEITSPFDGTAVGSVPVAGLADVETALAAAHAGAATWRATPAHERLSILLRAAELADERAAEIARLISAETGKTITEATGEARRSGDLIRLAAFEGTHLYGETLPLDANRGTGLDKVGFTVPQPCGVVVAISPFNYPALLVLHKLAPALAAGNAVILKPARTTPLTALHLAACFVDAGLPDGVLSVLTGPGGVLGDALVTDPRVRKVSFTGSTATGEHITRVAGVKRLSLELGASCPVVILPDADLEAAAAAVAAGGYVNAGQVCISVQRVITHPASTADFLVFEIFPVMDWDSLICGTNGEEFANGANILGENCDNPVGQNNPVPAGCEEKIIIPVVPGKSYILRVYNWSDAPGPLVPLQGRYEFKSL